MATDQTITTDELLGGGDSNGSVSTSQLFGQSDTQAVPQLMPSHKPTGPMSDGLIDHDKLGVALVRSHMLNIPATTAYQNHVLVSQQLNKQSNTEVPSTMSRIAADIKVGAEDSIFGLAYRNQLPEILQDQGRLDKFISGVSQMVSDLPVYLAGTVLGAAAGSEAPVVGNIAGGAIGTFAVPAAIRESLVLGIQRGDIKSFGDLMSRTVSTAYAGLKGGATGLAVEASGGSTLALGKALGPAAPAAEAGLKKLQQAATLTTLSSVMEGHMPTADDFAVNTALLVAMHYSMAGIEKAGIMVPKLTSRVQKEYVDSGTHPANIAAEALRQAQLEPTENVIDRINELTRQEQPVENKPEEQPTEKPVVPQPAPPSLRPAVSVDGEVKVGKDGDSEITKQDGESGFVNAKGDFLTGDKAKEFLRTNDPVVYQNWQQVAGGPDAELTTQDYNEAVQQSTGIKNASVDVQRAQRGLPPLDPESPTTRADVYGEAKAKVDSGEIDPLALADAVNHNPRGIADVEVDALNYYNAQLSNQHKATMDAIEQARTNDDPQAEQRGMERLRGIEEKQDVVEQAARKAGTQSGRALRARQDMIKQDYSLDRVLQRARVASRNGEVSPAVRDRLETLTRQLETANKKVEDYESQQAERKAQGVVERLQRDVERGKRKAARKEERASLDEELSGLVKEFDGLLMGRMSSNPMFDPEVIGVLGKMAKNRIESGITHIQDIVDDIHAKLTDIGHDVSKRDIMDAISGYGKTSEMSKDEVNVALRDAKRQGKLLSALEDAQAGLKPLKSGLQRDKVSDEVKDLQNQVKQAMQESGLVDSKPVNPQTALNTVKTRLRSQIESLTKQLETGEKPTKQSPEVPLDKEAQSLKDERDNLRIKIRQESIELQLRLRKALEETEGKGGISPEQRIKTATDAVKRSIDEYERRIKENDFAASRKAGTPETPELKALREQRDELAETFKQMKEASSPGTQQLTKYKSYLTNRIAEMEQQLKTGDFTKEPRKPVVLDEEGSKLKVKAEETRRQIDQAIAQQKRESRSTSEKVIDNVTKWRRAGLLTGWTTLGKLTKAAMDRMGVTPAEELLGGVLSHIPGIDEISKRAPMHGGGFNASAEVAAVSQLWQKATGEDMWRELKTGQDSLDLLFGGKAPLPPEVLGYVGQLHGALKVPEKRAEFFRRMEIGLEYAKRNNMDVADPRVQSGVVAKIQARAYDESLRAILMQKNVLTNAYNIALGYLHGAGDAGRAVEGGLRFIFPMVRIATNLPAETLAYTPPGLALQTVQAIRLLMDKDKMGRSAIDNLSAHDFDNVMRGLKKGSVGLALFALGFGLRKNITGYYTTEAEKKRGIKRGIMKIGHVTIPAYLNDTPPLVAIQLAATVGHVWDHYNMKGMSGGLIAGAVQSTEALAERVPFYGETARMARGFGTPERSMVSAGEMTGSLIVPRIASQIAEATDPLKQQRKARTFTEAIKLQVPGLRETVKPRYSIRGR